VDAVVARRDERAFGVLYDRHTPALYGLALRLVGGSENEATEIVHDAWIRATERLATFEWRSALRSWLSAIVINCWREAARAKARQPEVSVEDQPQPVEDLILRHVPERLDLERAIAALPGGCRQVFVLHDVEGYTHDEIGNLLGVDPGTSKSQLFRARRQLRRALEPDGETP